MNQNLIAFLERYADGTCNCDANERPENDCKKHCASRVARDALSEIDEVAAEAKRQIDIQHKAVLHTMKEKA